MNCQPAGSFGYVHLESPLFGWCGGCVPMTDSDGDGIHTVTVDLAQGAFEYKYAVDGFAGQEDLISAMVNGGDCAPITDYYSYANRQFDVNLDYNFGDENIVNGAFLNGSDIVQNGDFSNSGSNWGIPPGWSISGGKLVGSNVDGISTTQVYNPLFSGKSWKIVYTVSDYTQGDVRIFLGGSAGTPNRSGNGTYTEYLTVTSGNEYLYVQGINNFTGEIDNISIEEVGEGWSRGVNWLVSGEIAYSTGSNSNSISLANWTPTPGSLYSVTYDVGALTQGSYQLSIGGDLGEERNAVGTYTEVIRASTNASLMIIPNNNAIGAIDNVSAIDINSVSSSTNDVYNSCDECILGCTDVLAWNFDSTAVSDDGSCIYASDCANPIPTNLGVNWTTDTKASINWSNMNSGDCRVIKYFTRYRTGGSNSWSVKSAGVGSGLCNVGLDVTDKTLQGLSSGEIYEFQMKAFYCGGGVSGWSGSSYFSTATDCPELTNLAVETFTQNHAKSKFTWDTTGSYLFARVALRVDTVGSSWQTAGGFGVYYPTLTVNKFGLTSGQSYRAQGRAFCDANITSYRSTWTAPMFWTQPGVLPSRIDAEAASIINFNVYPNPSSDVFNVSFVSDKVQDLNIRVVNMIGEVVYVEGLEKFVGEYTKQININSFTKGVYFLEITTNNGVVNKKIVLQ